VQVSHAAGAANDPAFSGTMEFALFRDLTPITADFIAGFAQAGYYNGQIFHRIANLNPTEEPDGSFIIQGGDPAGTGSGGPGFSFDNEFDVAAIFTGRGQLAMANSGTSPLTFHGTNGSQFFITDGQPRFLDYNHTIFGQLLRGWDLLDSMTKVQRSASDKPVVDVKLDSATIVTDETDAILLISAITPGTSIISVEVKTMAGEVATQEFTVTSYEDTKNDPAFLQPLSNKTVAKDTVLDIPLRAVDLESDFRFYSNQLLSPALGQASGSGNPARVAGNAGYVGPLNLGVSVTPYDMTYRGAIDGNPAGPDDQIPVAIAVGDKPVEARVESFSAAPGVPLTNLDVARYTDADPRGQASDFTVKINWGDGTAPTSGTIARDPSNPSPTAFRVTGSHTYQQAGTYPVVVDLSATKGERATVRGIAVVTSGPLHAFGRRFKVNGATLTDGVVASFTDDAPVQTGGYSALIQWGDGKVSTGTIRKSAAGEFQVLGKHIFPDPEDYSVVVHIAKTGGASAVAWSFADVGGFQGVRHLPPFPTPNLIGQIGETAGGGTQTLPLRETVGNQTFANLEMIVLNAGSKASPEAKVQFFLSEDTTLNLRDVIAQDPNNPGQTIVINPRDQRVMVGTLSEVTVQSQQAGGGVRYIFAKQGDADNRLKFPVGDNGSGLNLIAHFVYTDPLADKLPIGRDVIFGPFDPFVVTPTSLTVKEGAAATDSPPGSASFKVRLKRQPDANVTIPVTLGTTDAVQITVDKLSLVFTPENWNVDQEVIVTAVNDTTVENTKSARVTLGIADSTDIRFDGLNPTDVAVTVLDNDIN
jgi:cyclophilin family peptidyl-prolyl cis-trans isomerase